MDVLLDGAHLIGSPIELRVVSAQPAVEQMVLSGAGMSKAVAGVEALLHVRVADRFGNQCEAGIAAFPYSFGLVLSGSTVRAARAPAAHPTTQQQHVHTSSHLPPRHCDGAVRGYACGGVRGVAGRWVWQGQEVR